MDLEVTFSVAGFSVADVFLTVDVHCQCPFRHRQDSLPCAVGIVKLLVKSPHVEIILVADVKIVIGQALQIALVKTGDLEEVLADGLVEGLCLIPLFDSSGLNLDQVGLSSLMVDNDLCLGDSLPGTAHDGVPSLLLKSLETFP